VRPEPFAVAAVGCLAGAGWLFVAVPRPLEAALLAAAAAVLGSATAGFAVGLADPGLPEVDYTAVGSAVIVASFLGLAVLSGRPAGAYLTALLGGSGAALVGLDSGLKRA
jgi:hypothetical protein